jgi:hypothetical protein
MSVIKVNKETQTVENVTDIFAAEYIEEIDTRVDLSMSSRKEKDIRLLTGNKKELRQKTAELLIVLARFCSGTDCI